MSVFRQTFDAYLRGATGIEEAEQALRDDLKQQGTLAAVHGAFIEAMYRGGGLSGDAYGALMRHINVEEPRRPKPQPQPPPPGEDSDKTIFRPRGLAGKQQPAGKQQEERKVADATPAPAPAPVSTDASLPRDVTSTTTSTTSTTWSDLASSTTGSPPLVSGSVIKERFVLEHPIGRGGMGTVYRARDLRKEEALDRNPHVAIKTLNEDFKRHPQALQALQREARKAQSLAHPNIVTVYDFDRDGTNVYMVMELLEGESLDRVIKRSEGAGVGNGQAWRIAQEICRGMSYAHEQGIVHADFKPANVFLTREGAVKIFDFGIARAVKRGARAQGAVTVFDPGTLGALTPAYASCEVIEGEEPDARDDVYAIACVVYELLTGSHPFKRMSADVARSQKAIAVRPPGVSWWRWRMLQRALEFNRERRPASATELLNAFSGRIVPTTRQLALAGVAAVAIVAVLTGLALLPGKLARDREEAIATALASTDPKEVERGLPRLRELDSSRRASLLLDDSARKGLIRYFEARMNEAVDTSQQRYDYPKAESLLRELKGFLSDSLAVRELADRLTASRNDEVKRQSDLLDQYLTSGALIEAQSSPNVSSVLDIVRSIDANSRLLSDPRLPGAFAQQTRLALQRKDTVLATELVSAGLALQPNDATLIDLRDQVRHARIAAEQVLPAHVETAAVPPTTAASVAASAVPIDQQPEAELRSLLAAGSAQREISLAEARRLAKIVTELGRRRVPDAAALERTYKLRLGDNITVVKKRRGVEEALKFTEGARELYPDSPLLNRTLASLRLDAAANEAQRRNTMAQQVKQNIEALLAVDSVDDDWPMAIEQELQRLPGYLPAGDPYLTSARQRAATLYMSHAAALRRSQRLAEATRMLERGRELGADPASLLVENKLLADARAQQELNGKARERAAQISALKEKLLVQAQANQVVDAIASLQQLRSSLSRNDSFITVEAPEAIARAYLRMASGVAREGRFRDAIILVDRAREVRGPWEPIAQTRKRYVRYQAIDGMLAERARIDTQSLKTELTEMARRDPDESALITRHLARTLATRINATQDAETAARLTRIANELFLTQVKPAVPVPPAGSSTTPSASN